MGIKKKCRELNQTKNKFLQWLKDRKAENIEEYEGERTPDDGWDYYRHVSAFIGDTLYSIYFTMWRAQIKIDYSDEENIYNNMSIEEFSQMLDFQEI